MKLSDLDYSFPQELIALYPPKNRSDSRMMVLDCQRHTMEHQPFKGLSSFFKKGDVLVVNNSKVFPCRLFTKRETGGGVECFLIREKEPHIWECLFKASKKINRGTRFVFSSDLAGLVLDDSEGVRSVRFEYEGDLSEILNKIGHIPLPPYIKRKDERPFDDERYQTVYAKNIGSVAAPTAGFHFSNDIFEDLQKKGVQIVDVTLHVGIGTFLPIRSDKLKDHQMHGEYYEISEQTAQTIRIAKKEGRSVITAVGTTVVRTLESAWDEEGLLKIGQGYTEKFIYPPYDFKVVDRLLTNFHQPKSSLLALVMAFAGKEYILKAYQEAIANKYRLFSYGDCMLIN